MRTGWWRVCLVLLLSVNLFAQVPGSYYSSATGKQGVELKHALHSIIKGHTEYSYTSDKTDTWDILKEADRDPNNPDNIILVYTGQSVNAAQEYNSAKGWTREHVWAKSRGDFGTLKGAGTDLHNLKPSGVSMNSLRNNRSFYPSDKAIFENGVFTGCYYSDLYTFEPRNEVKGDIARIIFYMAVRYEGDNGEADLELTDEILPSVDIQPLHGVYTELLKWNDADPVDDFERQRNDMIFKYQLNRNPFVDHPEWADAIWDAQSSTIDLVLERKEIKENEQVTIYNTLGSQVFTGKYSKYMFFHELPQNKLYIIRTESRSVLMKN